MQRMRAFLNFLDYKPNCPLFNSTCFIFTLSTTLIITPKIMTNSNIKWPFKRFLFLTNRLEIVCNLRNQEMLAVQMKLIGYIHSTTTYMYSTTRILDLKGTIVLETWLVPNVNSLLLCELVDLVVTMVILHAYSFKIAVQLISNLQKSIQGNTTWL